MISIISKIDGTSRKERYPVSIIVLASKVSDRRTKSEKRIRKLHRNIPYACRSKKVCNNSHALENNQEIRALVFVHTRSKFRWLIAFLRMKTPADYRRLCRRFASCTNAKLCPNLITTALNEFNRQPAQLDVWVSRRYDDEARGCGHESTTMSAPEQTLPFYDDVSRSALHSSNHVLRFSRQLWQHLARNFFG